MGLLGASAALHVLGAGSVHGQPPLLLPISKPSECDSEVPLRGWLVHSAQVEGYTRALRTGQGPLQASPPTYNVACAQHQLEKHFPTPAQELELLLIPGNSLPRVKDASSHLGTAACPGHGLSPGPPFSSAAGSDQERGSCCGVGAQAPSVLAAGTRDSRRALPRLGGDWELVWGRCRSFPGDPSRLPLAPAAPGTGESEGTGP